MTIENHEIFKYWGITGDGSRTCFPAAMDCVSDKPGNSIPSEIYLQYGDLVKRAGKARSGSGSMPFFETMKSHMYDRIYKAVGVENTWDVEEKWMLSNEQTVELLNNAREQKKRVVLLTQAAHVVGLRPEYDGWKMVGNELPVPADKILKTDEIFPHLTKPHYTNHNIILLPKE